MVDQMRFFSWMIFGLGLSCFTMPALAENPFVASYDRFFATKEKPDDLAGRILLTELNCTACHAADDSLRPKGGPVIKGSGNRLRREWLRNSLTSPSEVKPSGTMPHLMHLISESERETAVDALVAYLSSELAVEPTIIASGVSPVSNEFWLKGDAMRGRSMYHQIGCVACHAIDEAFRPAKKTKSDIESKIAALGLEPEELKEMGLALPEKVRPVPMSSIADKYSLRSLSMFLIEPHLVRPAGRMPSLKLQPHEAADIAAYLIISPTHSKPKNAVTRPALNDSNTIPTVDLALVAAGRKYFERLECVQCHSMPDMKPKMSIALKDIDTSGKRKGCLDDATTNSPRFGLSDGQVADILKAISLLKSKSDPADLVSQASDEVSLTMLQLNCYACHERNGRGGVGPDQWAYFENVQQVDIGDEGRMPPPLDHVGRKLNREWLQKVLEGKGDVRPHFLARMPIFSDQSKALAAALVRADRSDRGAKTVPHAKPLDPKSELNAGRELMDSGCVQCHTFRGDSLPGTIGIDLAGIDARIHREWFESFLRNPASLKKNTRMPTFFPDGKSSVPHILDGDTARQIDSIWAYLNAKDQPLPAKLELSKSQSFELIPKDEPILLRTFMDSQSAGTHAIAVGLPQQIHFAFDAKRLRLSEIWKGRFLNAQGTWFDRFAPPATPLGKNRILLPLSSFATTDKEGKFRLSGDELMPKFLGYRIDGEGVPIFRYSIGMNKIEDRISGTAEGGLLRRVKIQSSESNVLKEFEKLWLVIVDDATEEDGSGICTTRSKLRLRAAPGVQHQIVREQDATYWIVALEDGEEGIGVSYQW